MKKDSLYVLAQITVCNWYKSGDKKTVRREDIEPIKRVPTYVLFSVTVCKQTKWFEIESK